MKITTLIEDTCGGSGFASEHGLSFYIETGARRVLVDTGASDAFLANAERRGIDPSRVDTVVVSHGHYDHAGGVLALARVNPHARILISRHAFGEFYNLKNPEPKYIGMNPAIATLPQVELTDGDLDLGDGLTVFTGVSGKRLSPRGNLTLKRKIGEAFVQDDFRHEQYLAVTEGEKCLLISGCAHCGILNILDRFREKFGRLPSHVISGFHTTKPSYSTEDDALIEATARELAAMPTVFMTGHCTGDYPMQTFRRILGERLTVLHSGDRLPL